jgi:5-aminopentanamidase
LTAELRVAAIELPARFGDIGAGFAGLEAALTGMNADLVVLPEASLTGYVSAKMDFDLTRFAEPRDGPTVERIVAIARTHRTAICAPLIERNAGEIYNAYFVVDRAGNLLAHYRKRHPWFPETWATPGDNPYTEFSIDGARFLIAICFDIHFVADEAPDALSRSDILLFPSAWVEDGDVDSRTPILTDLAARFDLTVVNANWGIGSPRIAGQGGSRIVAPDGVSKFASEGPLVSGVVRVAGTSTLID